MATKKRKDCPIVNSEEYKEANIDRKLKRGKTNSDYKKSEENKSKSSPIYLSK